MKKIALLLTACISLGLVSCGVAGKQENTDTQDTVQTEDTSEKENTVVDNFTPNAMIVNRNGAKGVVTYVIDDYFRSEASFAEAMLDKYDNLSFSFAVVTENLATLKTQEGSDGKLEYVKDENGNYVYTPNEENVYFLEGLLDLGRTEIISHSHTHSFWGTNDDGGVFEYFKNDGKLYTSTEMPKGSSSKEIYASQQIIRELFPTQRAISFVDPGIGVRTSDTTSNGKDIVTYKKYFNEIMSGAIEESVVIGSRGTFQATGGFDKYVNTRFSLATVEGRMNVKAFMILTSNAGNGIENWTNYIDESLKMGGWACFCIHKMTKSADPVYHHILQSQAQQLFEYTDNLGEDVWVATFTDAMLYFSEWSTAEVSAEYGNGKITVSLTDKEVDSVYNMPLTVKVTVPNEWNKVKVGNETLTVQRSDKGTSYVYVNVVPDTAPAEIVCAD